MANDNTVRYKGKSLQLPPDRYRFHYVKVTVRVHEYPNGTLAVFHGPRCLARYRSDGRMIQSEGTPSEPIHGSEPRPIGAPRPIVCKEVLAHD